VASAAHGLRLVARAANQLQNERTERRRQMSTGTPHLQVDVNGVPPTLLFLVLVLTALGVIAHAAFI